MRNQPWPVQFVGRGRDNVWCEREEAQGGEGERQSREQRWRHRPNPPLSHPSEKQEVVTLICLHIVLFT